MKSAAELEKVITSVKPDFVALIVYGSPDPDAIASGLGLQKILQHFDVESSIFCEKEISLPNNQMLINAADISIKDFTQIPDNCTHYAVVDSQDKGLAKTKGKLECLIHIDHHKEMKSIAAFSDIDVSVGSCSTLLTGYLKELEILKKGKEASNIAVALSYGIFTDTNHLDEATAKDLEAYAYLRNFYDPDILLSIANVKHSSQTMEVIKKTLDANKVKGTFSYSGIGYVAKEHADSIAIAAEFLITKQNGISNVLVYGIIEDEAGDYIRGCFRTNDSALDTDKYVKSFISKGSGGGRKTSGGYQEPLGFLQDCHHNEKIWELVNLSIEDKILAKVRLAKEKQN